jgi:hypothetical protein
MKKYLLIILLVGVCFGQMKVYSEHPTDTLIMNFEAQFYGQGEKIKQQLQLYGFWNCINGIDCNLILDWDYLDKNGKKDPYERSKKGIKIENISSLINGIREISRYNFKKYDKEVNYNIGSKATSLEFKKNDEYPSLVSIQNDKYRSLKIVDSKKIILKLENWLSQEPIKSQESSSQMAVDKEKYFLLEYLKNYNIQFVLEFDNEKVVLINDKRFREGEYLIEDIKIHKIENDKITFINGSTTVKIKVGN